MPRKKTAPASVIQAAPFAVIGLNAAVFFVTGGASHILSFVLYCLAGMQVSLWNRGRISTAALLLVIVATAASASAFTPSHSYLGLIVLGCALVMCATVKLNPPLVGLGFIGRVSYSWYLLHSLFGTPILSLSLARALPDWVGFLIATGLTFALSVGTYYLIEKPGNRAGRWFVGRVASVSR